MDWLTVTAKRGKHDMTLTLLASALLESAMKADYKTTDWRWQRYAGRSVEGLAYGVRDDGAIVRASGDGAHVWWPKLIGAGDHVTRVDLEVTVRFDPPNPDLGAVLHEQALKHARGYERAPQVRAVVRDGRVETVYLGARSSPGYGRLYDKYAESEDPRDQDCWRFEVETKGDLAPALARRLRFHDRPDAAIVAYVWNWFSKRGVSPPWTPGDGVMDVTRHPKDDDDDRTIAWFRDQVAPALARLTEHGRRPDALGVMGVAAEFAYHVSETETEG